MGGTISAFTPVEGGTTDDVPCVHQSAESRAREQEVAYLDAIPEIQKTGPSRSLGLCADERSHKKTTIDSLPVSLRFSSSPLAFTTAVQVQVLMIA